MRAVLSIGVLLLVSSMLMAGDLKAQTDQLKEEISRLESQSQVLNREIEKKKKLLVQHSTSHGDMVAMLKQAALEVSRQLAGSLISAEYPQSTQALYHLVDGADVAIQEQMELLQQRLLQELQGQAGISRFRAPLVKLDGQLEQLEVTRVGPFTVLHNSRYLEYASDVNRFRELERQPPRRFLETSANLEKMPASEPLPVAIDPSRGGLLAMLVQTPSLEERVHQGGLVGYIILSLALIGILLALLRIGMLRLMAWRVARQKKCLDRLAADNPLGRVLLAVADVQAVDSERIERRLDEAILKEMPSLEWGLPLIKLLAAIAPLLGLLGTVVGMILTFQAISLFGSGDPKLMAGGISQALVTTVLGLCTAIPLLLLHSLAASSSRRIEHTLEEQSAALLAQRMEARPDV